MRATRDTVCALTVATLLTACGGGGGDDSSSDSSTTNTATGVFKDANVTGLEYRSGDRSGTTGDNGEFTFEVGESVTFSIGGVTIGTTEGAEVVTPVDLGPGDTVTAPDVVNRVRFLLFLDSDNDPANGIQISDGVRDVADHWNQVDFTSADLSNELTAIASDVQSIDGDAIVPSAIEAENHFSDTLRCLFSGAFVGDFSGDRDGRVAFFVSADDGAVRGNGFRPEPTSAFLLGGDSAVTLDARRRFVSGVTTGGGEFEGRFHRDGSVAGDWGATNESTGDTISGHFSGQRVAGDLKADYRFAGTFTNLDANDDLGIYAIDVTGTRVTGIAYSVTTGTTEAITGRVRNGTELDASTATGTTITGTLETALDSFAGTTTLDGDWTSDDDTGTFSGDGCRLN